MKAEVRSFNPPSRIKPDEFQVNAVSAALSGKDVLVVAPTGSGKTWIAEQVAVHSLSAGVGFIYASPLKALSNQKFRDFQRLFGEQRVGIITGDITINDTARLVVMTTEILRNKCLCTPGDLTGVGWIAIDEFHLIDSDRGAAWEESVIFTPGHIRLLCLSATVPNYDEVAGWLSYVRGGPVEVIVESHRPVPLSWRWFIKGRVCTEKTIQREMSRLRGPREGAQATRYRGKR
jgi:superfamily II RNA helicase